jgi:hypothetical protein
MRFAITFTTALALFCMVCGLRGEASKKDDAWKQIAAWRGSEHKITVLNGCELVIDGVRCRLFGIRLPKDDALAARAKRFLELYVKYYGNDVFVYNTNHPVSSRDGVPLVWLQGSGSGGWAQETLVQAGLARVDYSGFEDYHFLLPGKARDYDFDWKKCLKDAVASHEAGKKPDIYFAWPEPKQK